MGEPLWETLCGRTSVGDPLWENLCERTSVGEPLWENLCKTIYNQKRFSDFKMLLCKGRKVADAILRSQITWHRNSGLQGQRAPVNK